MGGEACGGERGQVRVAQPARLRVLTQDDERRRVAARESAHQVVEALILARDAFRLAEESDDRTSGDRAEPCARVAPQRGDVERGVARVTERPDGDRRNAVPLARQPGGMLVAHEVEAREGVVDRVRVARIVLQTERRAAARAREHGLVEPDAEGRDGDDDRVGVEPRDEPPGQGNERRAVLAVRYVRGAAREGEIERALARLGEHVARDAARHERHLGARVGAERARERGDLRGAPGIARREEHAHSRHKCARPAVTTASARAQSSSVSMSMPSTALVGSGRSPGGNRRPWCVRLLRVVR